MWPPAGAEPVSLDGFYEVGWRRGLSTGGVQGLTGCGLGMVLEVVLEVFFFFFFFGPAFQGLTAVWRLGDSVFAEVVLPEGVGVAGFGLHPALLDAALHAGWFLEPGTDGGVPFAWEGVSLHASGATSLRVRLGRTGVDALSIDVVDTAGAPVVAVDRLAVRALSVGQAVPEVGQDSLFELGWVSLGVVAGGIAGDWELAPVPVGDVRVALRWVLGRVQEWLAGDGSGTSRLVFVTSGATDGGDLAGAAVWGFVRCVQAEHPGRFVLLDSPDDEMSRGLWAVALETGEPQLRMRDGGVRCRGWGGWRLRRLSRWGGMRTAPC